MNQIPNQLDVDIKNISSETNGIEDMVFPDSGKKDVTVQVMRFDQLQELIYSLQLDNYQRPYVWNDQKINQLLSDLSDFSEQTEHQSYYMGSILLHQDDEKEALYVIDGQQRLSSLAVLYYSMYRDLPSRFEFHYRSQLSAKNLKLAQEIFEKTTSFSFDKSIFSRLKFTVITVKEEDLAFTFFDTQNNRGVPLKATDLLKAYHLRAVNNSDSTFSEKLQEHCARRWESVQSIKKQDEDKSKDFAPDLFNKYLWRSRSWTGQKVIELESHDMILESFQNNSIKVDEIDKIPLYPSRCNQFATDLYLQKNNEHQLSLAPLIVTSNSINLPFSLRQPIHKGIGFFMYAQKYAELTNQLFHSETVIPELKLFRDFYQKVVEYNSHYLRELFDLAVLMYVDQFGYLRLLEFACRVEMVLGAIRLNKYYIFKEAPLKYLKESRYNLLDVVATAYRPDDVMKFLSEDPQLKYYSPSELSDVDIGKGVRGTYLKAHLSYYNRSHDKDSNNWFEQWLRAEEES